MGCSVLAVHSDGRTLVHMARLLEAAGYNVIAAHGFAEGRAALARRPAGLMTALQLGEFNGLQLVIDGRAVDPGLAAVVMDAGYEAGREVDTKSLQAAYIVEPIRPGAVLALLSQLISGVSLPPTAPLAALYRDRRVNGRRVVDTPGYTPERRRRERRHEIHA
jgi:DNA-binding NtrC family response regulator